MSVYLILKFSSGLKREEIGNDQRPGRPSTSKTDDNNERFGEIVRQNRRLSIRAVAELINTDDKTDRQILHNNFNMRKNLFEDVAETPHS